jgi:hypothetical protein
MNVERFIAMLVLEILKELCCRLGHFDLCEKAEEGKKEVEAADELKKVHG